MATHLDMIRDIPGYKTILKSILRSQIQNLVEQLSTETDEESIILTASVSEGTLCHLGSDSGKNFLDDNEDIKSQFLGFCLKQRYSKDDDKDQQSPGQGQSTNRNTSAFGPFRFTPSGRKAKSTLKAPQQKPSKSVTPSTAPGSRGAGSHRMKPYPFSSPSKMARSANPSGDNERDNSSNTIIKIEPIDSDYMHAVGSQSGLEEDVDKETFDLQEHSPSDVVIEPDSGSMESGKQEHGYGHPGNIETPYDLSIPSTSSGTTASGGAGGALPFKPENMNSSGLGFDISNFDQGNLAKMAEKWGPDLSSLLGVTGSPMDMKTGSDRYSLDERSSHQERDIQTMVDEEDLENHYYEELVKEIGLAEETSHDKEMQTMSADEEGSDQEVDALSSESKPKNSRNRVRWTSAEVKELTEYFKEYLVENSQLRCPGKRECLNAIQCSKSKGGPIAMRTWEKIKKKVNHMILTMQKNAGEHAERGRQAPIASHSHATNNTEPPPEPLNIVQNHPVYTDQPLPIPVRSTNSGRRIKPTPKAKAAQLASLQPITPYPRGTIIWKIPVLKLVRVEETAPIEPVSAGATINRINEANFNERMDEAVSDMSVPHERNAKSASSSACVSSIDTATNDRSATTLVAGSLTTLTTQGSSICTTENATIPASGITNERNVTTIVAGSQTANIGEVGSISASGHVTNDAENLSLSDINTSTIVAGSNTGLVNDNDKDSDELNEAKRSCLSATDEVFENDIVRGNDDTHTHIIVHGLQNVEADDNNKNVDEINQSNTSYATTIVDEVKDEPVTTERDTSLQGNSDSVRNVEDSSIQSATDSVINIQHVSIPSTSDSVRSVEDVNMPSTSDSVRPVEDVNMPSTSDSVRSVEDVNMPSTSDSVRSVEDVNMPSTSDSVRSVEDVNMPSTNDSVRSVEDVNMPSTSDSVRSVEDVNMPSSSSGQGTSGIEHLPIKLEELDEIDFDLELADIGLSNLDTTDLTDPEYDTTEQCDQMSSESEWQMTDQENSATEEDIPEDEVNPEVQSTKSTRPKKKRRRFYKSRRSDQDGNTLHHRKVLSDEDKLYCLKHPGIYIKRCEHDFAKERRLYDIVHACIYCGQLYSNIYTHLVHRHTHEEAVKEIMRLKHDKDTTSDLDIKMQLDKLLTVKQVLLRNKGNHKHNQLVWKSKQGELLIARRVRENFNSEVYAECPNCLEWLYMKGVVRRHHLNICPGLTETSRAIVRAKKSSSMELLLAAISILPNDEITRTATSDPLIISMGELHYTTSIGDSKKRKQHACSRMRLAAQLLHLIRKEMDSEEAGMTDCLNVSNFNTLVKCALFIGGKNAELDMENPADAKRIGFDLLKLIASKISMAEKEVNYQECREAKLFQTLMQREWKQKVSKQANTLLAERKLNCPAPEEIANLGNYLVEQLKLQSSSETAESICTGEEYRRLAMLTETRLLLYNCIRPDELEQLSLEAYEGRSRWVSETDSSPQSGLTVLEKQLLKSLEFIELERKNKRMVPVILPGEVEQPLKILADQSVRETCGISPSNKFLFGTAETDPLRAGASLNDVKYDAGLISPFMISTSNLRKHTITISQLMGLKDEDLRVLVNSLGDPEREHLKHYQDTAGVKERLDIAKVLLMNAHGDMEKFAGMSLDDIKFEDLDDIPVAAPAEDPAPQNPGVSRRPQSPGVSQRPQSPGVSQGPQSPGVSQGPQSPGVSQGPQRSGVSQGPQSSGVSRVPQSPRVSRAPRRSYASSVSPTSDLESSSESEDFEENDLQATWRRKKNTRRKSNSHVTRIPWSDKENEEIQIFFKDYISLQSSRACPGMLEILQVIDKSKTGGGQIWKRDWEVIKKKVSYLCQKSKKARDETEK